MSVSFDDELGAYVFPDSSAILVVPAAVAADDSRSDNAQAFQATCESRETTGMSQLLLRSFTCAVGSFKMSSIIISLTKSSKAQSFTSVRKIISHLRNSAGLFRGKRKSIRV